MDTKRRLGDAGLTMVELVIAMAIGMVLVAGMYRVFISSTITYREQDTLARMQENVRMAMDMLSREIRMAGSPRFTIDGAAFNTGAACTINAAFDTTAADIYVPVTIVQGAGANNSDRITVRFKDAAASACTQVRFSVNPATAATDPATLRWNRQLGAALADGEQAVVDGVESLQALYGLDTTGDGSIDAYCTSIPAGANPIAVRIRLLMRTAEESTEAALDTRTYDIAGGAIGAACPAVEAATIYDPPDDRRARRIFTTTITLRNQLQ